jgi:uncharacterized protein (TIGR03435 family)
MAAAFWGSLAQAQANDANSQPQSADPTTGLPSFEVVSIKTHPPGYWPTFAQRRFTTDGFVWRNAVAQGILVYAYNLRDPKLSNRQRLIPGGEKWMFWDWFDIEARMSEADVAALQRLSPDGRETYERELVQSMLADRFKLKVHHVTRNAAGWELVVAQNGPKAMKHEPDSSASKSSWSDLDHVEYDAVPIAWLIQFLEGFENAPVLDKTGLKGKYDFKLEFARDSDVPLSPGNSLPATNDSEPSMFTALQEQLGLKLIRTTIPMDEIVIDHIEKPSPN